jgi:hypothetical protein
MSWMVSSCFGTISKEVGTVGTLPLSDDVPMVAADYHPCVPCNYSQYYTTDVSEAIIKGVADEMVKGGYRDAGYKYVCIDDGWSTTRDPKTKELVADPVKFPSGKQQEQIILTVTC